VSETIRYLAETVPTVRRRYGGQVLEEHAADLLAAEYRHTTARGVMTGELPDPQLHSHVAITAALRNDGRFVAVASRPIFRSARELGAYYRSALAQGLIERGFEIESGTGKHGRYFEVAGVPRELLDAFSSRSREVARAVERFRAHFGRAPERGELRRLKSEHRAAKVLVHRGDLDRAWRETAERSRSADREAERPPKQEDTSWRKRPLEDRVEVRLTERAATFEPRELRAVALEQSVGERSPREALSLCEKMVADRRVLALQGGLMTTGAVRAREQAIERRFSELASAGTRDVGARARSDACDQVAERIGAALSDEQRDALMVITKDERCAILTGPAGTGKGVVIDAAARAEQLSSHETLGIAVSGSTAQRLGQDSPALAGQTLTLDALIARVERGQLEVGKRTTIYFDEAAMADTERLERLSELVHRTGSKLVAIGDAAQLPAIGAGGMFESLARIAPSARLSEVRRTPSPSEQRAWADLRAGRSDRALAHYLAQGRLHMTDTRDQALERAVASWARLTETHPIGELALTSDASNREIDRMNARAQRYRAERGELGELEVDIPGVHYGVRTGDRVALVDQHREPGSERIENGSRGEVLSVSAAGEVEVQFDVTGQRRALAGDDLARLRLGYAQHIHRAQGQTVARTLVLTGGWQTAKEPAYVEASRAREGTDWFIAREDLGTEGHDAQRIERLARSMRESRAQTPSLSYAELPDPDFGPSFERPMDPNRTLLPGIARTLERLSRSKPPPERER
jgi:hypothetical protein